ncbi:MAG: hypothetical protein RUMPE_00873 [Eubacteriales bacterium SKADARSKE-1]|nr:hypothetical protein [Eubacteriales bacterium SKADARSKE-1]
MVNITFPTSKDIYIEVNGKKLAAVESYEAKTTRKENYIESFGESEPVCVIPGKIRHTIELSKVYICESVANDNINFYELTNFNLVIVKPDKKIIYSGCEWLNLSESTKLNEKVFENAIIVAIKRLEVN